MTSPGPRRRWPALTVAVSGLAIFLILTQGGCLGSKIERHVIDLDSFSAWAGQAAEPDSLEPARVPIESRIPGIVSGSVEGIEEVSLFVRLRNAALNPPTVNVAVYAFPDRTNDRDAVLTRGIRLHRPIQIDPGSAFLIDARNYSSLAEGFEDLVELMLSGDFYLYVIADSGTFEVNAEDPSLALLVTE